MSFRLFIIAAALGSVPVAASACDLDGFMDHRYSSLMSRYNPQSSGSSDGNGSADATQTADANGTTSSTGTAPPPTPEPVNYTEFGDPKSNH